jgi:hypothetical protein
MLQELLDALPNVRSVAVYEESDLRPGRSPGASQRTGGRAGRDADDGAVTAAALALVRSRNGAGSDCGDCVIVRRTGSLDRLVVPVRGGCLSFAFAASPDSDAALRPAVAVLDRCGIHTVWVML